MRAAGVLIAIVLLAAPAAAGDFDVGLRAANRGDFAAAARAWRPPAEAGEARAQYHLGLLYEEGRGLAPDLGAAARWYRAAAERGHAQAQNALAILYVTGQGLPQDRIEAYRWFARAAAAGDGFAARNLERLRGRLSAAEIAEGKRRAARDGPDE